MWPQRVEPRSDWGECEGWDWVDFYPRSGGSVPFVTSQRVWELVCKRGKTEERMSTFQPWEKVLTRDKEFFSAFQSYIPQLKPFPSISY